MTGVRLGAGLLIALGVGAAGGGWWLPVGALLAGVLAWLAADGPNEASARPNAPVLVLTDGVRLATRLSVVPVFASAFAAYLLPGHRTPAAVVFVLVMTVAHAVGLRLPGRTSQVLQGIILVAGAGLVALCLAVPPERGPGDIPGGGPGALGLFAAGAVLFPFFDRGKPRVLAATTAVAAVVSAVALYQLGPLRLALSAAPVRDVLAAADGQSIQPLLGGVVVLMTVPAALHALAATTRDKSGVAEVALCGLLAAAGAAAFGPRQAVLVAGALALAEVLVRSLLALSAKRTARPVLAAVLSVSMLAWVPPADLLVAVLVLALGVAVRLPGRRRRA